MTLAEAIAQLPTPALFILAQGPVPGRSWHDCRVCEALWDRGLVRPEVDAESPAVLIHDYHDADMMGVGREAYERCLAIYVGARRALERRPLAGCTMPA